MATLVDWTTCNNTAPKSQLRIDYTWNASTRQYTVTAYRRCGSSGAWYNTRWSCTISTTYGSTSGTIKNSTSGTIGQTAYSMGGGPWTVPNDATSVSITISSTPNGGSLSGTLNVPLGWTKPGQTYVTRITNNTTGTIKDSGDQAIDSTWWSNSNTNTNYAGDSLTLWWDKNSPDSVGIGADPTSRAFFTRDSDNNQDTYDAVLLQPWDWTGGGGDLYNTSNYTIAAADAGCWLKCMMHKSYVDSGGTRQHFLQGALEYVKPQPSVTGNIILRSKRFYSGTPSCKVWQVNSYSTTNNGYGMSQINSNDNAPGYTNATNVFGKFYLQTNNGASGATGDWGGYRWGSGAFNANYTLPTALSIHSNKVTLAGTATASALCFTNWFNPRTGATGRLGYKSIDMGQLSNVTGTIELPTIDGIKPVSGNGTTVIVDSTKNVWTNQANVKLNWRVTHSGNNNGFGYDARVNENSGTYSSTSGQGASLVPVQINLWSSPYGAIDNTADTISIQHDNTTTTGSQRSIAIVPYIKDSSNYQIFGAANTTNGLVVSTPYTVYRIQAPNAPVLNSWTNTLPAIDGIKDVINWTATSPSSWGNVTDFTYGYKMRYKIGNDTARSDGYQWYYPSTPTTTNTSFSGSFTQTYNRSVNTTSEAQIAATSYYSTTWNAYLDFQSSWSPAKSFNIVAKDPYTATTGTLTTSESTTLKTNIPYKFKCPSEVINGNTLIQSTTLIIDGGTPKTITSPTYSTTTPNSATGALTLSFNDLNLLTDTLARGAHTIVVKNEVATYFDSSTPVTNHVYFGSTTVTSNTLNVEVAELPTEPTVNTPSPQYFKAGSHRQLRFTFSPNDWGCLDTTYNNRHYDYELIGPNGQVLQSHTLSKNATEFIYPNSGSSLWISPDHEGTYTFKLRQTSIIGSSEWVEQTIEIQPAEEPGDSNITATNILALNNWSWTLKITPGSNGSYVKQPNAMVPISGIMTTTKYLAGGRIDNPKAPNQERALATYWSLSSQNLASNSKTSTVSYQIKANVGVSGNTVNMTSGSVSLNNSNIWSSSTSTSLDNETSIKTGTITVNHDKTNYNQNLLGLRYEYLGAKFNGHSEAVIGGTTVQNEGLVFALPATPDSYIEGRYKVEVVQPNGSTYTVKQTITNWTTINNGVSLNRNYTNDLSAYVDGLHKILVTYERNYTAKVVKEQRFFDIVPPEVKIRDRSTTSATLGSNKVTFNLSIDIYAGVDVSEVFYSMDYGNTWTAVDMTSTSGAHKYFEKTLQLNWLDEIWLKAHGKNAVNEKTIEGKDPDQIIQMNNANEAKLVFKHEMPSDYKVWLSWSDRVNNTLLTDVWLYYTYDHDDMITILNTGNITLDWSGSLSETDKPSIVWQIIDSNENVLLEMSNDGNRMQSITPSIVSQSSDAMMRIGFRADAGSLLQNHNITPSVYQTPGNNLFDYRKFPDKYIMGNWELINNKNGSFAYRKINDNSIDFIRRIAMSRNGADTKKVQHIKKI